ncbi:hypothetical protein CLF_106256 [Clonorchis sinensis]|uniref:ANK_REP_REGION domain-containing protein n=1 Tax=Clonorchis sinensis TaxID=79923 RepID=G7YEX2_CLOSI|nr:hypothetical protein CLF_106256 [Clonorchis sinensis]
MANYHNVSLYPNQAKLLFSSGPMDWLLTFWGKVFQKRIMDFKRESLSYDRKREIEAINQTASDACDKKGQFKRPRPFDMDISIGFPHSCGDVAIPMQTALHYASKYSNAQCMRLLVDQYKANVNARSRLCRNSVTFFTALTSVNLVPFHFFHRIKRKWFTIISQHILTERFGNLAASQHSCPLRRTLPGRTESLLQLNGYYSIIFMFYDLVFCSRVIFRRKGQTPLHVAVVFSQPVAIRLLVEEFKADSAIMDFSGRFPVSYLKEEQRSEFETRGGVYSLQKPCTTVYSETAGPVVGVSFDGYNCAPVELLTAGRLARIRDALHILRSKTEPTVECRGDYTSFLHPNSDINGFKAPIVPKHSVKPLCPDSLSKHYGSLSHRSSTLRSATNPVGRVGRQGSVLLNMLHSAANAAYCDLYSEQRAHGTLHARTVSAGANDESVASKPNAASDACSLDSSASSDLGSLQSSLVNRVVLEPNDTALATIPYHKDAYPERGRLPMRMSRLGFLQSIEYESNAATFGSTTVSSDWCISVISWQSDWVNVMIDGSKETGSTCWCRRILCFVSLPNEVDHRRSLPKHPPRSADPETLAILLSLLPSSPSDQSPSKKKKTNGHNYRKVFKHPRSPSSHSLALDSVDKLPRKSSFSHSAELAETDIRSLFGRRVHGVLQRKKSTNSLNSANCSLDPEVSDSHVNGSLRTQFRCRSVDCGILSKP